MLTFEQSELQTIVRRFVAENSPLETVRNVVTSPTGFDPALWRKMAAEMGLSGLAIEERFGGAGFQAVELSIVAEELGRGLVPSPFLGSAVLSASFLGELSDPSVGDDLLVKIADGTAIVALAIPGRTDAIEVREVNGVCVLSGSIRQVLDGEVADTVIVVAEHGTTARAYVVSGSDPSLQKTALSGLDLTRRQATLTFNDVPAHELRGGNVDVALRRCLDVAALAVSAEQLGVLRACIDMTVSYVKDRVQFDRPVGSFQAVKHGCAEMWVRYELAEAAVRHAAASAASSIPEDPVATTLALVYCSEAVVETASDMIQYHGGIAYTWEHDAHLYYRRAHASSVLLGRPAEQRARLAELLGI